ncbi:AbfB domain-containing protein [Actinoplanes sp. N902-109]|uniref:AbfB domain-containing protein n=1 Tax=Actinoplanes sp. (strain N902-109) TaxID=649831 RepID=UPI0003294281|nr:AbfB domain-containing protein [Actinoplanes sp. N902-109]AGL17129.1 hypothetical protein L083_3619 [Actinoplanes sp. N902-109]
MKHEQPAGTVYGRGGVDVREPRQGLLTRTHPAMTAAVCAGIIAVLALAYGIWRATASPAQPVAAAVSASPSPVAASSAPPPARLTAGQWLLSPSDDPTIFLTTEDGYAALADEKLVLTVVAGRADESCFSFRTDDGRFMRHFDYRLRFDADDGSELFRNDATFCPDDGTRAGTVRLRSKNYPDHVVHRRGTELYIDEPEDSGTFAAESTFKLTKES